MEAWNEAARRSAERRSVYREIMGAVAALPEFVASMEAWARADNERLLAYLEVASAEVFMAEASRLLESDSELASLSPEQQAIFFQTWEGKGNRESLAQTLLAHPDWQTQAWRFLAEYHAGRKDFQSAYETVRRFAASPPLPNVELHGTRSELETQFLLAPDNLAKGLSLLNAQIQEERFGDALQTLHLMQRTPQAPRYLWFMEAGAHARLEDWESAR